MPSLSRSTAAAGFGPLLSRFRRDRGVTQTALAEKAHITPEHLCRIEKGGRSVPRLSTVERIAAALALAQEERSQLLAAASQQLDEALRLAREHGLVALAGRARFEMGNLLAQKGDLPGAVRSFLDARELDRGGGDHFNEILSLNNASYHSILMGELAAARIYLDEALRLASERGLKLPLQYLYSTSGELALAEGRWIEASDWFQRGIVEARAFGNVEQAANSLANLGLAARAGGDLEGALSHLLSARDAVSGLRAPRLRTQIQIWLAELFLERGERAAALEALDSAIEVATNAEQERLRQEAVRLKAVLEGGGTGAQR